LTAVDSVILVVDVAKGVEAQTRKLMQVCRMRNTPVIIFVNKMDREGQDPFDILEELENELKISTRPLSWPINMGSRFKGVYLLHDNSLNLFEADKTKKASEYIKINDLSDQQLDQIIGDSDANQLREDVELINGVFEPFDRA